MKNKPPSVLWVIIDKRGTILEKDGLQRTSERNMVPDCPGFSMWRNKSSAIEIIRQIKAKMTKECWDTWKFKIIKYKIDKQ